MLDQRVERLEADVAEIRSDVRTIRSDLTSLDRRVTDGNERLARIEGRLDQMPDASTMWKMVVGTWIAGAGIVMLAVKLLQP